MAEGKTFAEQLSEIDIDEPEVEQDVTPQQAEAPSQPRAEDGKFAKKGVEPQQEEIPAATEPPSGQLPKDVYEPLKAIRAENQELKQLLQQLQQPQQNHQPIEVPDMFADPEGWQAYQQTQIEGRLYSQSLAMSERFARQQYGADVVEQAKQWGIQRCDQDPVFNNQVYASGDPVGYVVQQFQRDQITSQVTPEDFAEFQQWRQTRSAPTQEPRQAPPSLTGERNIGGRAVPENTGPATFGEILQR